MEKESIALHQTNQNLSNADYKQGFDNKLTYRDYLVNEPIRKSIEIVNQIESQRIATLEQQQALEKKRQLLAIKQTYQREYIKACNLSLAYAILTNRKDKLEFIPSFVVSNFLRVVSEKFSYTELKVLNEKIKELIKEADLKIVNFKYTSDLAEISIEKELLKKVSDELDFITSFEPHEAELELTRAALTD